MDFPLNVTSEIGPLRRVLLKRPGLELENLTPDSLGRLLFDDLPYLPIVQEEHDYFAHVLKQEGVEVLYLEDLMSEVLDWNQPDIRKRLVQQFLDESKGACEEELQFVEVYLSQFSNKELVRKLMCGVRTNELPPQIKSHLHDYVMERNHFYIDPLPNLYFTRDPAATIHHGITINSMKEHARKRESMFMDYILHYHPLFSSFQIPIFYNRMAPCSLEGGDLLVLSEEVVAVGISQRTSPKAIELLAKNLFSMEPKVQRVLAVEIPKCRAFMHLDTVLTMVSYEQFTAHPLILDEKLQLRVFVLSKENGEITVTQSPSLQETLKKELKLKNLEIIPCGGGDEIVAAREQWNDGSNTLALAPGVVVTYDRNYVSNELLRQNGIRVIEIRSSELSRGRGGPRCMSMPLIRENLP